MAASSFQPILYTSFLTDADVTRHPASDGRSEYVLPPETLTAARVFTIGLTGSPQHRSVIRIVRQDKQAFTYTVKDDAGTTLYTFGTGQTTDIAASFYYDDDAGHWKFLSVYRVGGGGVDSKGTDLTLDETISFFRGEHGRYGYFRITSTDDPPLGHMTWRLDDTYGSDQFPDGAMVTLYNATGSDITLPNMAGSYTAATTLPLKNLDDADMVLPNEYMVQYRLDFSVGSDGAWVQVAHPRGISETDYATLTALRNPKAGTDLTDANQTLQPFTDKASQYTQSTALTASRNKTLGTTTVVTGTVVRIVREDTAAFTMPIINGGGSAGTLFTFGASPTERQAATFYYNGADWVLVGFEYLAS